MPYCPKCGKQVGNDANFCPSCGEVLSSSNQSGSSESKSDVFGTISKKFSEFNNTDDTTESFDPKDVNENKAMGILAYISILVLVPLLAARESRFARFHVNQGLVLLIASFITNILSSVATGILSIFFGFWLSWIPALVTALFQIVNLIILILSVIGVVNAANGRAKALPIIGEIHIIK